MQINNVQERVSPIIGNTWTIVLFFVCFAIITLVRINYPKRFGQLFETFANQRTLQEQIREEPIFSSIPSVLTQLLFLITSALFVYEVDQYFQLKLFYKLTGFSLFMMYVLVIFLIYFVKWAVSEFLRFIFYQTPLVEAYLYTTLQYNKMLGIVLFVLSFLCAFMQKTHVLPILWLGFLAWLAIYIYRLLRGVQFGLQARVSISYLFLYLCALEISPALVFAKLLIANL